jgi:hypothetical protein
MMFPLLGTIFYVALLLVNAMAVLSEDRFLARSEHLCLPTFLVLTCSKSAGLQANHK